jgi:hypothetical protein
MEKLRFFNRVILLTGIISLFGTVAFTQVVVQRKPSEIIVKPSTTEPPIRQAPSPEMLNTIDSQGIRDVKIVPAEQNAEISFRARPGLNPLVEISREKPVQGEGKKLEFPNRVSKINAEPIPSKYEIVSSGYTINVSGLESGTRYYYLITVGEGDSIRQSQGRFSTFAWKTEVKVVFTEIKVTNDSDDGGDGELLFHFFVNSSPLRGNASSFMSWSDEEPAITVNREYEIPDAPDSIELAVNGFDDDTPFGLHTGINPTGPLSAPYDDGEEANVAKKTFNLRDFPGAEIRHDFVLESMAHAKGQGDLSFYVRGYFVIKREKVKP